MSDEPKTNPENDKAEINVKHGKESVSTRAPKNGDETRTLSSQFPPAGFALLDALGKEIHSDRAATIRWCLNYTLRHVIDANGNFNIPDADRDFIPHANMIDYCLAGIRVKK